jgi:hypothetical protein
MKQWASFCSEGVNYDTTSWAKYQKYQKYQKWHVLLSTGSCHCTDTFLNVLFIFKAWIKLAAGTSLKSKRKITVSIMTANHLKMGVDSIPETL